MELAGILFFGFICGLLTGLRIVKTNYRLNPEKKENIIYTPSHEPDCPHNAMCKWEGGFLDVDGFVRCRCRRK